MRDRVGDDLVLVTTNIYLIFTIFLIYDGLKYPYTGAFTPSTSPLVTMNSMEAIENMHEDNLPEVLEVF